MSVDFYTLLGTFTLASFASGALVATALVRQRRAMPVSLVDSDSDDESVRETPLRNDYGVVDAPYKMLLCVNMDLRDEKGAKTKMKPGKTAAQCCHACLGAYKKAIRKAPNAVRYWSLTGQAKVCVKVPTEADLDALIETFRTNGIVHYLVEDAGRTQVAPGSRTVLAVGPAPVAIIDQYTKHLKLY